LKWMRLAAASREAAAVVSREAAPAPTKVAVQRAALREAVGDFFDRR
jgi:hypothetical protein